VGLEMFSPLPSRRSKVKPLFNNKTETTQHNGLSHVFRAVRA